MLITTDIKLLLYAVAFKNQIGEKELPKYTYIVFYIYLWNYRSTLFLHMDISYWLVSFHLTRKRLLLVLLVQLRFPKINSLGFCLKMFSVQFSCSVVSNSLRPHELQHARLLLHCLPEFAQTHIHWVDDAIQPSHPPLSPSPPAPNPSKIRVFSNESTLCMRWPKYWSFSLSISASNEHPELISFRMDWLEFLAVQRTLKSLLQHHSSKASILQCSAFFTVQLSHPYMTTGKTIALTRRTFVGKVMSLLLNMLPRLVITFLPRSNGLSHLEVFSLGGW